MSTPQEFLLHKGAQSREQQRRSFGIKQSPNFKLGGNNNSNSNTNFRSAILAVIFNTKFIIIANHQGFQIGIEHLQQLHHR